MHSQKMRLISLNLVLVMLLTMLPVQAADIVVDDDGPMYTVVLNGNGGTYEGDDTLTISYGSSTLYLEDYIFTREGYTLLGWSKNEDVSALDYTRFGKLYAFDIGNDTQLYAVWGEGENCALYTDAIPNADYIQLGQYCIVNSETLPTVNESGFVAWYDHINGVYYAGDTVRAGEVYRPIRVSTGNYPILLEGNGGKSTLGNSLFYSVNGYFISRYDDGGLGRRHFDKDGYILSGWENSNGDVVAISGAPLFGLCIPDSNGIITLRAHWSPAYQLTGGTKLVIDGEEMNELSDTESHGSGWNYYPNGGLNLYNPHGNSEPYSFGNFAYDADLHINFESSICTGQIEANNYLTLSGNNASREICILTQNTPAVHAERVSLWGEQATYRIVAENAVGIDAPYVDFDSPNITITGNPAVHADAKINCSSGIGYTISEDKTTLTTYAIEQKITLNGNGGTLGAETTVSVDYSVNNKLDLSRYAFTRDGYVLIGWAADVNGENFVSESNNTSYSQTEYQTLYAVWLEVPEQYAIFSVSSGASLTTYDHSYIDSWEHYYSLDANDVKTMPVPMLNGRKQRVVWQNTADRSILYGAESYTPAPGSIFEAGVFGDLDNGCHTIIIDGNGGKCRNSYYDYYNGVDEWYDTSRIVAAGSSCDGDVINYAYRFTRSGYKLVSYNSEPDGSGIEYALNKCTVTADMLPIQILYAQWEEIGENGKYITIDGKQYDAAQDWSGMGWEYRHYGNDDNEIVLNGYNGGTIESDMTLRVSCYNGKNYVTGGIRAPQLDVNISANGNSGSASLTLHAQKGAALISQGNMQIHVQDLAELSVVGAEGYPAVSAGGELNLWLWREGRLSAQGGNTAAISAESIVNISGRDYLITAGASPDDAVEVDAYSDQQYVSYKVRTMTLTLHGSGGTADGKDSISVDTKEGYIDLGQYANTFSNGGKVLLGWSMTENSQTIDYSTNQGDYLAFAGEVSKDLYAVWDSNGQKGIVLNGYGGLDEYENYIYYERFVSAVNAGTQYTLPDSYKAGYRFLGWCSTQDSKLYPAGTEITVEQSMTYTAEYEVLSMTINGKSYRMDKACGSSGIGWMFTPDGEYGYYNGNVELQIFGNYSGKPIDVPSNVNIRVSGNITGSDGRSAISVDGNASICAAYYNNDNNKEKTAFISGGNNAPAIEVAGTLVLSGGRGKLAVEGGSAQPALHAAKVVNDVAFLAGTSETDATYIADYKNESYICFSDPVTIMMKATEKIPQLPNTSNASFVGWRVEESDGWTDWRDSIWYLAGDIMENESRVLTAHYNYTGCVILNGNGGTTERGSKYYLAEVSGPDLVLTKDQAINTFQRTGYELSGYGENADGSGKIYTPAELSDQSTHDNFEGKILTFFAQWTKTGDPDTPAPDGPITTLDGSASYTVSGSTAAIDKVDTDKLITESNGKKSAELDLSNAGESVTEVSLPTDAVKTVSGSGAEKMTVKLPGASVSFDKKALSAIAAQSEGERVSFEVSIGDRNSLNTAQTNAVAKAKELSVIEVSLSSGNQKISDFNGGSVTIDVPFAWSMKGLLCAYYIDDSGNKSAIDVTYKNGVATLVLKHFSTYVIEIDKLQEPFVTVLPDSITVSVDNTVRTCVAAIYDEVGKLITLKTCEVVEDGGTVTIPCQMERLTGNRMLKVFFLDSEKSPCRETATLKATE